MLLPNFDVIYGSRHQIKNFKDSDYRRFISKIEVNTKTGCYNWTASVASSGHGFFRFAGVLTNAHIFAHLMNTGMKTRKKICVCHICDNPMCVRPDHLFTGTTQDNTRDKMNKGRQPRGQQIPGNKLSVEEVIRIRSLHAAPHNVTYAKLSRMFSISPTHVKDIVMHYKWKWVDKDYKPPES